ncbi:MAG: hypothetical protein ACWGPR_10870 [Candidatus Deferrimicrobiaceae bacterium]
MMDGEWSPKMRGVFVKLTRTKGGWRAEAHEFAADVRGDAVEADGPTEATGLALSKLNEVLETA